MLQRLSLPTLAAILLACPIASAADPIRSQLDAAKENYGKEMAQFRKLVDEWLKKREELARKDGNKKLLDQVKEERAAFEDDNVIPVSLPSSIHQRALQAKKLMDAAYAQAIKDYTRIKKDKEAAEIEEERKIFEIGAGVDLLALVKPAEHRIFGTWKAEKASLVGTAQTTPAVLQLPYEPADEYDVGLTVRRTEGKDGIGVGLIVGGRRFHAIIEGWPQRGPYTGLELVDLKTTTNVTMVKGEVLKAGKENTILCSVRREKIEILVNGKVISAYKGSLDRLSLPGFYGATKDKALFLSVHPNSSYEFTRLIATPVKGKGTILK